MQKKHYKKRYIGPTFRKNREIQAPEVRVIGEDGENLGVMALADAQEAAIAKDLDLVEISASAKPPVVRIISFDKFRYQKEKELKKQQQTQTKDMKQIQIGVKSAMNDLLIRSRKIDEFLKEGYKVEVVIKLRGREKANKEWARGKLLEFLDLITVDYKISTEIKPKGPGFNVQLTPKNHD